MKSTPEAAIVTTTIHVPKLLESYAEDAKAYHRDILFIVIADQKTPPEAESFCTGLAKRMGTVIEYFSVKRQEQYLARFPSLREHIPYNCVQRRNIGMLYAYEAEAPLIVTIDDDNLRVTDDYIGAHRLGGSYECEVVSSSTGWINVCRSLRERRGRTFYHRGFPLEKRLPDEEWSVERRLIRPVVNAGLWLGDPDVDAIEHLYRLADPIESVEYTGNGNIAPSKGTWTPFNSQNTALLRDIVPAYFLSPHVGRYDDIWAAYIVKHIADRFGDVISFGHPIVRHERNPHDYWIDLANERFGQALTLRFVAALKSIELSGKDYSGCFNQIIDALPQAWEKHSQDELERHFVGKFLQGMMVWQESVASL